MGNKSSSNKNLDLPDEIDRIATNYILSQNFNDINKSLDKDHCDKLLILTAKIIDKKLNPLEQKNLLKSIVNKGDTTKKPEEKKPAGVEGLAAPKAEPLEKKPEEKKEAEEKKPAEDEKPDEKKKEEKKPDGDEGAEPLEYKDKEKEGGAEQSGVEVAEPLSSWGGVTPLSSWGGETP